MEASTSRARAVPGSTVEAEVGGDVFGGVQVDAVDEDGEVPEQALLVVGEQLVRPLQGGPQRPVPGVGAGLAAPRRSSARSSRSCRSDSEKRGQPAGGELDGQWHPVQSPDDVGDQRRDRLGRTAPRRTRAARSRNTSTAGDRAGSVDRAPRWRRERGEAEDVLGGEPERLPAGGQHLQSRAGREQPRDQVARRVQQVLAVVDDQQPAIRHRAGPSRQRGHPRGSPSAPSRRPGRTAPPPGR